MLCLLLDSSKFCVVKESSNFQPSLLISIFLTSGFLWSTHPRCLRTSGPLYFVKERSERWGGGVQNVLWYLRNLHTGSKVRLTGLCFLSLESHSSPEAVLVPMICTVLDVPQRLTFFQTPRKASLRLNTQAPGSDCIHLHTRSPLQLWVTLASSSIK